MSRKLIYVHIIHTSQDMGSLMEKVRKAYIDRYGEEQWDRHLKEVDGLWSKTVEKVRSLKLDHGKVRLYQDGMPICDRETEIVNKLAADGNTNHQLLLELIEKGAIMMGTEDPALLIKERDRLLNSQEKKEQLYDDLMEQRDEYIAERIAATLKDGETGILFMGALHQIADKLPGDVEIQFLFGEKITPENEK
ncbi:MAG: TraB/GumN family protein [bacterium]